MFFLNISYYKIADVSLYGKTPLLFFLEICIAYNQNKIHFYASITNLNMNILY